MRTLTTIIIALLCGCTHSPKYTMTSSQPAYIEIDGVVVCDTTPCTITPPHRADAVLCDDIHPVQSQVVAFPLDKTRGFVQQKTIKAKCGDVRTVFFDMEATAGVKMIQENSQR